MLRSWFAVFALILLSPVILRRDLRSGNFWIVWNVGQGQWSTFVDDKTCRHFDMGGEKNPLRRVAALCREKNNFISLSHWDWDHISFAMKSSQALCNACLETPPLGKTSTHKMGILKAYRRCALHVPEDVELTHFLNSDLNRKTNELSHVLLVENRFLIPGDSTARQEMIWSHDRPLRNVKYLLLGHHGSRTSTSEELLSMLPFLRVAISSARFARYGHPHEEVIRRLRKYRVILLKTEDWGNLWFEQRPQCRFRCVPEYS